MDQTELLVKKIVEGLQEKKGKEIAIIDLTKLSGAICQYMVICEGNTPTQVGALSDSVWDYVRKELSDKPISIDGEKQAQWIGMDYARFLYIFLYRNYVLTTIWRTFGPTRRLFEYRT